MRGGAGAAVMSAFQECGDEKAMRDAVPRVTGIGAYCPQGGDREAGAVD